MIMEHSVKFETRILKIIHYHVVQVLRDPHNTEFGHVPIIKMHGHSHAPAY